MGGDRLSSPALESFSDDDESSLEQSHHSLDATEPYQWRRAQTIYHEIFHSYDDLHISSDKLREAKAKILSYTPGAWIEKVAGTSISDYDVPKTTSLILIGPRGSGKSSLINRISKVFEDDQFASERAQVSYNSSAGDGTYFVREYMIPRGSTSFCLYNTRSLSDDFSENTKMLKRWMTKGVQHGKLVVRGSDCSSLRARMKCKARRNDHFSSKTRMVNFVIFVINGLSVLKSMGNDDEAGTQYVDMIAKTFSYPYLSFKDDKPAVVITHGDLLSVSDRTRIRVHLGELLGIPPTKQIFDIPDCYNPVTELAVFDMLRYSLEHADRNLPHKNWVKIKVGSLPMRGVISLIIVLGIAIIAALIHRLHHAKRHIGPMYGPMHRVEARIDWHTIRHLW